MNDYYLSHGGPGSGRYPLGSGDRPYQKFEKSRGRTSGGIVGYIKTRKAKKAEEQLEKQKKETAERKRQHDADRERILQKGTATEVMRYQGELSNEELQKAFTRLNLETNIKNLSKKEIETNISKVDNIMKTVQTGTNWVKIATDTYNTIAAIYNATEDGKKKPLTLVKKG